jgi:hypothetical protein
MHRRAYRPEAPVCLEDRSLSSVVAGHPAHPYVYSRREFNFFAEHMRTGFELFGRYRDLTQLHSEIEDIVGSIPFGKVDGLEDKIDRIVDRMLHELSSKVPHAVRSALDDVVAVAHAGVEARVRAGDVVIR